SWTIKSLISGILYGGLRSFGRRCIQDTMITELSGNFCEKWLQRQNGQIWEFAFVASRTNSLNQAAGAKTIPKIRGQEYRGKILNSHPASRLTVYILKLSST